MNIELNLLRQYIMAFAAFLLLVVSGPPARGKMKQPEPGHRAEHRVEPLGTGDLTIDKHVVLLYCRAAQYKFALRLLRLHSGLWARCVEHQTSVLQYIQRHYPDVGEKLKWKDPEFAGYYFVWLIEDLADNALWLSRLGYPNAANIMLRAAEKVLQMAHDLSDNQGIVTANALAMIAYSTWRESPEPLNQLEKTLHLLTPIAQLFRNAHGRRLGFSVYIPSPAFALFVELAVRRGWTTAFALLALKLSGCEQLFFKIAISFLRGNSQCKNLEALPPGSPLPASAADDATYAMNLPFFFVPPARSIREILHQVRLPPGAALLLGSGDGPEVREIMMDGRFTHIIAIDHSCVALERVRRMTRRLIRVNLLPHTTLDLRVADVAETDFGRNKVSYAVAHHVLEFVSAQKRQLVYHRLSKALKRTGIAFLAVHAAQGDRFFDYVRAANVQTSRVREGIKTIARIPTVERGILIETKYFFNYEAFVLELKNAGFGEQGSFALKTWRNTSAGGFVELGALVMKL